MKTRLLMAMLVTALYACGADSPSSQAPAPQTDSTPASSSSDSSATVEATSFLGRPLLRQMDFPNRDQLEANLAAAEADYAANPGSADALIWLGRVDEAAALLEQIHAGMDIIENDSYLRRMLMYKGELAPEALLDTTMADDLSIATQGYGVGNWYLVNGQRETAKEIFEQVIAGRSWSAFGYIAAEAELARW